MPTSETSEDTILFYMSHHFSIGKYNDNTIPKQKI